MISCVFAGDYYLSSLFLVFLKNPKVLGWWSEVSNLSTKYESRTDFSDVLALHSCINLFVKSFTGSMLEFWVVSSSKFYDKYLSSELFLCGSKTSRGCQKLVLLIEAVGSCTTMSEGEKCRSLTGP